MGRAIAFGYYVQNKKTSRRANKKSGAPAPLSDEAIADAQMEA